VLFAPPIKNAHRWLRLGLLSFQPSELAKLALVVTLAFQLSRRVDRLSDFLSGLAPSLLVTAFLSFLVLMEPDFGTASILVVVAGTMFFVAGAPLGHLARLVLLAAPLVYLLVSQVDYRRDRWLAFLAPWDDALGGGFQAVQAQIAVGSGGWMGRGFMQSRQKLFFLPEPHTDFVYAVVGEELGLVGTIGVLVCFSVLLWRGLTIARRAPDVFGSLLAAGLTAMLALQAFMNMGVVLSLLPTTGIPLPFISSGGSSLLCSMLAVGVLLSVSQHAR
jgi:cell division protein FtsW